MTNPDIRTPQSALLDARFSRRAMLRGTIATGAGVAALSVLGGAIPGLSTLSGAGVAQAAALAGPLSSDLDILNYALTLEHLESAAYKAINDANVLTGRAATYFKAFGQHEQDHVAALVSAIKGAGGTPVAPMAYNFSMVPKDAAGIVKFFQGVEDLGASAYLGAAGSIQNADILDAALAIHAVEAEHAAALADLVAPGTDLFAPMAFAMPKSPDEVFKAVAPFLPAATPTAMATATAAAPAMPRTGGGGGQQQQQNGLLGLLGLLGIGAAGAAAFARRRDSAADRAE